MSKEKPILFSPPMVRAILDGRKTQTRRLIKFQLPREPLNVKTAERVTMSGEPAYWCTYDGVEKNGNPINRAVLSPYYIGDVLWVRETWTDTCGMLKNALDGKKIHYCADCKEDTTGMFKPCSWKKKSSIHMPREAARLFLRVTDVRTERLQDITEEDAEKEGVTRQGCGSNKTPNGYEVNYRNGFMYSWDEIYTKDGTGWDSNPWVWVYTFERAEVRR
jgi:hypothetical protein